jgi:hypothetical protein
MPGTRIDHGRVRALESHISWTYLQRIAEGPAIAETLTLRLIVHFSYASGTQIRLVAS